MSDVGKSPVDYWVWLNTAAEHGDRHLRRRGGKMENMSAEVAMMFIRNCPNSDLSSMFKCKPISKWSAKEVQEAIDEHQREHQIRKRPSTMEKFLVATAATSNCSPEEELSTIKASVQDPVPLLAVCGVNTHMTRDHCMKEKRCFGCLETGHQRRDCTRTTPRQTQSQNHTPDQAN